MNRLLKRVRDHAEVNGDGRVDGDAARARRCASSRSTTRAWTPRIGSSWPRSSRSSGPGPVGVAALAAVLSEEVETIEDVYEPFLLRLGFLDRTPQGRIATDLARAHLSGLGYEIPPPRRGGPDMPEPLGWTIREPAIAEPRSRTPEPAGHRDAATAAPRPRRRCGSRSSRRPARGRARGPASGASTLPTGSSRRPQFMPVGTNATVKALDPDDLREVGRVDHPRQHLPPLPAPRPRADRAARRPAPVHGLGPADPHRLRAASRSSRWPTCGSSTRTARRSAATSTARSIASPRRSRSRVQEALGPDIAVAFDQPGLPVARRATRSRTPWSGRTAGPSAALPRTARPDQALFGIIQGGVDPELRTRVDAVHRRPSVRRDLHRRPGRRRDAGPARGARWTSSSRSWTATRDLAI